MNKQEFFEKLEDSAAKWVECQLLRGRAGALYSYKYRGRYFSVIITGLASRTKDDIVQEIVRRVSDWSDWQNIELIVEED